MARVLVTLAFFISGPPRAGFVIAGGTMMSDPDTVPQNYIVLAYLIFGGRESGAGW